jgi:HEAT repeat protein
MLAAQGLLAIEGTHGLDLLFERLKRPAPDALFLLALQGVVKLRDREKTMLVYQLLLHREEAIRKSALHCLASFDTPALIQSLLEESRNENAMVRVRVAEAMGQLSDRRILKRLQEMRADFEDSVRQQAVLSLAHTGGAENGGSHGER